MPKSKTPPGLQTAFEKITDGIESSEFSDDEVLALIGWVAILKDVRKKPQNHKKVMGIVSDVLGDIIDTYENANDLSQDDIELIIRYGDAIDAAHIDTEEAHLMNELYRIAVDYEKVIEHQEQWEHKIEQFGVELEIDSKTINVLKILSRDAFTDEDKKQLKTYLDKLESPMAINRKLKVLEKAIGETPRSSPFVRDAYDLLDSISDLKRLTYKARKAKPKHLDRLEMLMIASSHMKYAVKDETKLNLYEAAIISDVSALYSMMNRWFANVDEEDRPFLAKFAVQAQQFSESVIVAQIKNIQPNKTLFAFTNSKKLNEIEGKPNSKLERLFMCALNSVVDNYNHTATVYLDDKPVKQVDERGRTQAFDKPSLVLEHLTHGGVEKEGKMNFEAQMYSDLYVFDVSKLVPEEYHESMRLLYTDAWRDILNGLFSAHERHAHDDRVLRDCKLSPNTPLRTYVKAGAESTLLHGPLSTMAKDVNKQRNKALSKRNKEDKVPMLCSQYTAYTTMIAIENLNRDIRQMVETHNRTHPDEPVAFKKEPISSPIAKTQKMNMMHPGQFFKLLQKKGCVEILENKKAQKYIQS